MKKTLRNIIAGINLLGIVGCSSFPQNHIHGVEYQTIDQTKTPHKLEEQILYGERYYFQKIENPLPETLPLKIWRFNDVTRELDLDTSEPTLISEKDYVPKRVEVKKYTEDKWADEIELTTKGPYGIRANITCLQQLKLKAEDSKNKYGFKVITTEDDASFAIRTMKIFDEVYFFPHVANSKINEKEKLSFYIIPEKKGKIKIKHSCGNITIRNKNNIYRPELTEKINNITPTQEINIR